MTSALDELKAIVQFIHERVHGMPVPGGKRETIVWGFYGLAIEHQSAIAFLADADFWGSAFALLRVLTDTTVRATWLAKCATDEQIDCFLAGRLSILRNFKQMTIDLEAHTGASKAMERVRDSWGLLSDYLHTGTEHAMLRFDEDRIAPRYPSADRDRVLRNATAMGLIAATYLAELSENSPVAVALLERAKQSVANR